MVAHLLRLKLLLVRNGLKRSTAALVGLVVGAVYGGGLLVLLLGGLVSLRFQGDLALARTVTTLVGSGMVLGWAVVPVLLFGTDPTLDPARFSTFAIPRRQFAVGLGLSALVGLPGAATVLVALATTVTWSRSLPTIVVALLGAPLGVLTGVLLSRILTSAAATALQSRRGRDILAAVGLALLVSTGPTIGLTGMRHVTAGRLEQVAEVVGWTPLGWAWAAPADVAQGRWANAGLRLLLALALTGALLLVWERLLGSILANPRSVAGSAPEVRRGLGLFGRLPGTARGAVAARSATYWRRDPRMAFPAVMSTIVPLGLVVVWKATGSEPALLAMPVVSGFLVGWGPHNDVGYDSTAFWLHVASGVDGLSDRLGRLFPLAVQAAVAVPLYSLLGAGLARRWDLLPAMSGAALGVLLSGFAVASVVSAVKQYPVPGPGDSPFATPPGGAGITLLVQLGCSLAVVALSAPVLVLAALALAGQGWAGWAALGVGPLVGGAVLALALRVGSGLFDRRGAVLLQDLVRVR